MAWHGGLGVFRLASGGEFGHDDGMRSTRRTFFRHAVRTAGVGVLAGGFGPWLASGADPATPAPVPTPSTPEPPLPEDAMAYWKGMWIQQDSGGVMDFRPDGTIIGVPVGGKFELLKTDWIHLTSGTDVIECRWKNRSADIVHLARFIEGRQDTIELRRLLPMPLNLRKFGPKCVIRHLVAGDKTATNRSVLVDPKTGHFRNAEGGFYLRLTESPSGAVLGYAPGLDSETTEVRLLGAGRYLVAFDRLQKPRLFASCLFVE